VAHEPVIHYLDRVGERHCRELLVRP
jgi:hypothetical protein